MGSEMCIRDSDKPIDKDKFTTRSELTFGIARAYATWMHDKAFNSSSPVQQKMLFFWHGILTSAKGAGPPLSVIQQVNMMHASAMSPYSTILHRYVIDPLLMAYLDADTNTVDTPNENLARELMELFTWGPGNYSQGEVEKVARAISGWRLDRRTLKVKYEPSLAYTKKQTIFGQRRQWNLQSIVDYLLAQPETAQRIGGMLWWDLTGGTAPSGLGKEWIRNKYSTTWLLKRILKSAEFKNSPQYARTRSGYEYILNVSRAVGFDFEGTNYALLGQSEQAPWSPPNVAGWPKGDRWVELSALLDRSRIINQDFASVAKGSNTTVNQILDRCSIFELTSNTARALESVDETRLTERKKNRLRWWIALSSPEAMYI